MHVSFVQNPIMSNDLVRQEQGQRLAEARRARGFRDAKAAADYHGWADSTYSQHERGLRGIQRSVDVYARAFRCSVAWLLTGDGRPPPKVAQRAVEADEVRDGVSPGAVPEFGLRSKEPYGAVVAAEWVFPPSWLRDELRLSMATTDVITIIGPSLEPEFRDGDRVVVDRSRRDPHQGGIFAVRDGESTIVTHVELVRGESGPIRIRCWPSASYQPFDLILDGKKAEIIGRVAAKISRL